MNTLRQDMLYQAAWWLCAVTLPWSIPVNSLCIILLAAVWVAGGNWNIKWERLKKAGWIIPFVLFFALHAFGLLYTQNLHDGLSEIEKKLTFVVLPVIAATGKPLDDSFFKKLKEGFVFSCAALIIGSLAYSTYGYIHSSPMLNFDTQTENHFRAVNPLASPVWEYFSYIQAGSWMELHPAYFSLHIIFCLLIVLGQIMDENRIRKIALALLPLFTFFLALLASRMAILSFVIILVYFIINQFQKRKWVPNMMALSAILIVLSGVILINPVSRFRVIQEPKATGLNLHPHVTQWNSVNLRLLEWQASWSTIRNCWWAGVGTGDGQDALKGYYASFNNSTVNMDFNSHNQYFQTIIELGIGGIASLLICFFLPSVQTERPILYLSFIMLFSLMCLTESMLARQKGIVFFTLFQSLFLSIRPTSR